MEENKSNEIKKAYEKDIENGGQGLAENQHDVEAVRNEEKSADEIERMMSMEEVFTVVKENGMYMNMLAPCLSANIFLDGRIMNYFLTPMKPIDLEEKVSDVMNLVLMEISKEQNGVVFKADGSIDVGASIKQSALNGISTIPLLKDTMPEGMVAALEQRYFEMHKTGMDAAWGIKADGNFEGIDKEHLEKILSIGIKNSREALKIYNDHDKYHGLFGDGYSNNQRAELRIKKEEAERKIQELEAKADEIRSKLEQLPGDSEEYKTLFEQVIKINEEKARYSKEIDKIGNLGEPRLEEVQAKGLLAEVRIMQLMGFKVPDYKHIAVEIKNLNQMSSIAKLATRQEGATHEIERKYLDDLSKRDATKMQAYKDELTTGAISEEDRGKYLVEALKNYFTYSSFQSERAQDVISPKIVNLNINQALEGIILTVPNAKGKDGELNWTRILDCVKQIPGYEELRLDDIKNTFLTEKANGIKEELDSIIKSAELDFTEYREDDDKDFVEQFKENDKELDLVKYINYFRRLKDKGIENAALNMFKYKLQKEDMQHILDKAEETYEYSEGYVEEMMDNYKRGYALSKYSEFKTLSARDKRALTKEEKGAYISSMIAAYDISRDETDISLEMQDAAKDVLGTLLGDVFDEQGDIDDEKVFKAYKNTFKTGSKFALGKESEDIDAFFRFHEVMSLTKVQKRVVDNFMKSVKDRKKDLTQEVAITEPEAKKVVAERGEVLDASAITNPEQAKVSVPQITKEEAEDAVDRQGETMRVDDPKDKTVETKKQVSPSIDKAVEEQGNTGDVRAEKMQVGSTAMIKKKEEGFFAKAWSFLKEKVSNLFGGNSDSNNSDSGTSTSSSGGIEQENKTEQAVNTQNNSWVQQANLDVKAAQDKANESKGKEDPAIEDDLAK